MKRTFIALALLVAALPLESALAATLRAEVNGMVCAFCAQGIEKKIRALDATQDVYVNLARKTVAVEAKPGMALDEAVIRKEIKEAGYEVRRITETQASIADIKAELKAEMKKKK
jgi:mercuric ion binding protein